MMDDTCGVAMSFEWGRLSAEFVLVQQILLLNLFESFGSQPLMYEMGMGLVRRLVANQSWC
jgi:hypothetical protein